MVIGVTGKYCAGKNRVARLFEERGFFVIDVDAVGHEVLAANAARVLESFGPSVGAADGGVDRRKLGRLVFADPSALARLEAIVHPSMVARVKEIIAERGGDIVVNAAILHHMGLHVLCHAVVCVTAPFFIRCARAVRRDALSVRDALARVRSQRGVCPQLNDPLVDTYIVRNGGSARSLEHRVARLALRLRG
jgi:dephospho-CoA kinase